MAYRTVEVLSVHLWGERVGAVTADPDRRAYLFEYEPSWRRTRIELAPTLMPVTGRTRLFSFSELPASTYHNLPPMLADSIPDRFGNALIDAHLAREGVMPSSVTALDRLAYVGDRGMGALTFVPDTGPHGDPPTPLVLADLVREARAAVQGSLGEGSTRTQAMRQLLAVGTSAGGARAKAVIAWNRATGDLRAGNLPVPQGYEQWLLKFDGVGVDAQLGDSEQYGRIEFAYSNMARVAGLEMSETHLLKEGGRAHFMTRRFDRSDRGERLHMQSLCALAAMDYNQTGTHDYASYLLQCESLGLSAEARAEAFRRIVFNVVASNCDDHTKNFSFLMNRSGRWSLAPAYDITFAHNPSNVWLARHLMGVEGKFEHIGRDDLLRFADRFEVPGYGAILSDVTESVKQWPDFAKEAGVSTGTIARIGERLAEVSM